MARTGKDIKRKYINPNQIKTRDWHMVNIINGVTKSGYEKNIRKFQNKYRCRDKDNRDTDWE